MKFVIIVITFHTIYNKIKLFQVKIIQILNIIYKFSMAKMLIIKQFNWKMKEFTHL